jgi:hypothetical protein
VCILKTPKPKPNTNKAKILSSIGVPTGSLLLLGLPGLLAIITSVVLAAFHPSSNCAKVKTEQKIIKIKLNIFFYFVF